MASSHRVAGSKYWAGLEQRTQKVFCVAQIADMVLPVPGDSKVEPVHRTVG